MRLGGLAFVVLLGCSQQKREFASVAQRVNPVIASLRTHAEALDAKRNPAPKCSTTCPAEYSAWFKSVRSHCFDVDALLPKLDLTESDPRYYDVEVRTVLLQLAQIQKDWRHRAVVDECRKAKTEAEEADCARSAQFWFGAIVVEGLDSARTYAQRHGGSFDVVFPKT